MILRKWKDPNYKFRAKDADEAIYEYFCYAVSPETLNERLKEQNLLVEWIHPYDFGEWKDKAERARLRAIAAHDKAVLKNPAEKPVINFKQEIWAELKWHLFELFDGKCAYCECKPRPSTSGDVEHYRPKAKVDENPGHHGYYWLAYDYRNMLPSCPDCNRAREGKMSQFPVVDQVYARAPEDPAPEQPLLLHPFNEALDPLCHLEFDAGGGALAHKNSIHGEASRKCYHLNRAGLGEARRTALGYVQGDLSYLIVRMQVRREEAEQFLEKLIRMGNREYSAAQLWELERITNIRRLRCPGSDPPDTGQVAAPVSP
jgi:hypothetical protein